MKRVKKLWFANERIYVEYADGVIQDQPLRFFPRLSKATDRERSIINKTNMITIPGVAPDMIANNLEPAYPTHPGEVLKDEIEYRGISQRKLAAEMDIPYTQLNEVLNAKRPVNTEFALLIEAVLDLPAEPLLKMQARYNVIVTKRNDKFIQKLNNVRKAAATLL